MKIKITQTLPDGQVKQQTLTKQGREPLKIQVLPNAKVSFSVEMDSSVTAGKPKSKTSQQIGDIKRNGNHLVLESGGEPLVEISDFYSTQGTSVSDVSWHQVSSDSAASNMEVAKQIDSINSVSTIISNDASSVNSWIQASADSHIQSSTVSDVGALPSAAPSTAAASTASTASAVNTFANVGLGLFGAGVLSVATATSTAAAQLATARTYSISIVFGPQTDQGSGTVVTLFKDNGEKLGVATYNDKTGKFEFIDNTNPPYSGLVIAQMVDIDASPDYINEATGKAANANGVYLAVAEISGAGGISLNINPLTTIAAQKLGISAQASDVNPEIKPTFATALKASDVSSANKAVATAFNLGTVDITKDDAVTVIKTDGNANTGNAYGKALAVVSQMEQVTAQSTTDVISSLANALDVTAGTLTGTEIQTSVVRAIVDAATQNKVDGKSQLDATYIAGIVKSVTGETVTTSATGLDVTGLSNVGVTALTVEQISSLSAGQIANLGAKLSLLSGSALESLSAVQLSAITEGQLAALGTNVFSLSSTQIDLATNKTVIDAAQIAALPANASGIANLGGKLSKLSNAVLSGLNSAQLAGITANQIDTLSADQVQQFVAKLASLSDSALSSLDSGQLESISASQFAALGGKVFSLSSAEVTKLSVASQSAFTSAQTSALSGLTSNAVTALGSKIANFSDAALAALTAEQASGLTAGQIDVLSKTAISKLSTDAISKLNAQALGSLDIDQLGALTVSQVGAITADQLPALSAAQLQNLSVKDLSSAALAALNAAQAAGLSNAQLISLGTHIADLSITALTGLSTAQLTAVQTNLGASTYAEVTAALKTASAITSGTTLDVSGLSAAVVSALNPKVIGELSASAVAKLSAEQLGALTAVQVAALSDIQIDNLTGVQLSALNPSVIASLSVAAIKSLDAVQIGTLKPLQIAQLTATQIDNLSVTQIQAIDAVGSLSTAAFGSLDETQIKALTASQISKLTGTQASAMTLAQVVALDEGVAQLSTAAFTSLSSVQIKALSSSQLSSMVGLSIKQSLTDDLPSFTGTVNANGLTNDSTPTFSGTLIRLPAGAVIAIYDGAIKLGNATVTDTAWTFTPSALTEQGSHSITARVEVIGGKNATDPTTAWSFSLDSTPPTSPVLALGSGVSNGATADEAAQNLGVVTVNAENKASTVVSFTDGKGNTVSKTIIGTGAAQAVSLLATDLGSGVGKLIDGNIIVSAVATDTAGNSSSAGTSSFILDTKAPTVSTVTDATKESVTKDPIIFTVTFDEAVVGTVGTGNFTTTNGTVSSVSQVGTTNAYTVLVTPTAGLGSGSVALSLVAGSLKDAAGNALADADLSSKGSQAIDTKSPAVSTVTDATSADVTKDPISFTVTFDEAVVGTVGTGNFTATNGTVSSVNQVGTTNAYSVVVTPTPGLASGSVALSLVAGSLKDAAGNALADANLSSKDSQGIDTKAPSVSTVTDTTSADVTKDPISFTVTFNEVVVGTVGTGNFTATNGTVSSVSQVGTTNAYTVVVTPTPGLASASVALNLVGTGLTDALGNSVVNASLSSLDSQSIDTKAPLVSSNYSVDVAENTTVDSTPKVIQLATSVANEAGITWSNLGGADVGLFTLDADGKLHFKSASNYEVPDDSGRDHVYNLTATLTDAVGNSATGQTITVNVTDVNDAPTANGSISAQTAVKGQSAWQLNLSSYFADVDATDTRSYALTSGTLPTGLELNSTSGVISGTPSAEAASGSFTVTMTDKGGQPATQTFSLKVVAAPVINSFTVTDNNAGGGSNAAIGKNGDTLTFAVTMSEEVTITGTGTPKITFLVGGVDVLATYVSGSTNVLTFTGTAPSTGNGTSVTVKSIDLTDVTVTGKTSTQPWQTSVVNQSSAYTLDNTNPSITTETLSVGEKATAVGSLVGSDTNGVTWTLDGAADDNGKFSLVGGALAFTNAPDYEVPGSAAGTNAYTVKVKATDDAGNSTSKAITVNVTDVNEAPTVTSTPITDVGAVTGTVYTIQNPLYLDGVSANISSYFTDPDTTSNFNTLAYSLDAGAPLWLNIDPTTGKLYGTAPSTAAADLAVTVKASDGANTVSKSFNIDLVSLPGLKSTQALDNVINLDVKSALVLDFTSDNLALGSGQIRIKDDMGAAGLITRNTTSGVANNSKQDVTDNDVVITLTDGVVTDLTVGIASYTTFGGVGLSAQRLQDSVKVSGSKLIIDIGGADATTWGTNNTSWNFDWDFGASYHVEFDAGVVKAGAGGPVNLAMTNDQTLNFTTVTPADGATGAASLKMVSDGSLASGYIYHNAHQGSTSGLQAGAVDLNFSTGAHALVIQVNSVNSTNAQLLKTSLGGNTDVAGFGIDDVLYNDNGGNMLLKSIEGLTGATWSGSGNATTASTNSSTTKRTVDTDVSGQATWTWFGDAAYTVGAGFGDSHSTLGFEFRQQSTNVVIFG